MKPKLVPDISVGHLIVAVSFLITLGVVQIPRASEIQVLKEQMQNQMTINKKQDQQIDKLIDNQHIALLTFQEIRVVLDGHLKQRTGTVPVERK